MCLGSAISESALAGFLVCEGGPAGAAYGGGSLFLAAIKDFLKFGELGDIAKKLEESIKALMNTSRSLDFERLQNGTTRNLPPNFEPSFGGTLSELRHS